MSASTPLKSNGEKISRHGTLGNDVFSMGDLLDYTSGGVITLPTGKWIFRESFSIGTNRFYLPIGWQGEITVDNTRNVAITYEGTGTMWTVFYAARLAFVDMGYILTGIGAQFIDVTGSGTNLENGIIQFQNTGQTIGTFTDCFGVYMDLLYLLGHTNGMRIIRGSNVNIRNIVIQSSGAGTGPVVSIEEIAGTFGPLATINQLSVIAGPNESVFFIDPCANVPVSINDTVAAGYKDFWEVRDTGSIASFTDVSTGGTAVSVTDDSGDALFTSVAHGLVVGETPVHTTSPEASYNVSLPVTDVPTADTYKVGVDYVSDETLLFETTTCQVNAVAHGLMDMACLCILDTLYFNAGYKIFNVQTDSFEITLGKPFPPTGTETGTWSTSSLTSQSPYVNSVSNGEGVRNSKNVGAWLVGGNTAETDTSTRYQFVDFNLGGLAVPQGHIEQWTVIDPTTGAIRFDGLYRTYLTYKGHVTAKSAGSPQEFRIRLMRSRNGAAFTELPAPDNVDEKVGVAGFLQTTSVQWSINVYPGDVYKMQVANWDGISKWVIDTVKSTTE